MWTRGTLYDRADYPAMTSGFDRVLGECWAFREAEMAAVLRTLDAIEGANQPGQPDLYRRVEVEVWSWDVSGDTVIEAPAAGTAFAYHYASDPELQGFVRMKPGRPQASICWPPRDRD